MTDLAEYVSDYYRMVVDGNGEPWSRVTNREIAEMYADQNLPEGEDFDEFVEKLVPQVAYYTEKD